MIFGKRPPRSVRRHLEAEIAAKINPPGDGALDPQVIRTPPMKPFARATAPAALAPKLSAKPKPAPVPTPTQLPATPPPAPKTPPRRAKAVAQPNPRGGRSDSHNVPGHTLVVGRDIRLTGEISACQRLIVEGSVEAELTDTLTLEIAETGHFRGSAAVGTCVISGSFDGDLTVSGLLAVRAGGRIGGAIRYGEIEVERGGRITGRADVCCSDVQGPKEVPDATHPAHPPQTAGRLGLRPA